MAVNVIIKSKGLFKKEFKLADILLENMRYGIMDEAFRLEENKVGEYTVIFNKDKICRGYEVSFKKGEIDLRMPLPTSTSDIIFFYDYVKILCQKLKTNKFIREDIMSSLDMIDEYVRLDREASVKALEEINKNLLNGEYENMYIFGAINPIALGKKELSFIGNDPEKLGELANNLQKKDVYYAKASVYSRKDETLFGVYVLTENILSVMPFKAKLFMANNDLKVNDWYIGFVVKEKLIGFISYENFIKNIKNIQEYDSEHFIIKLDDKEIDKLLKEYKVEP